MKNHLTFQCQKLYDGKRLLYRNQLVEDAPQEVIVSPKKPEGKIINVKEIARRKKRRKIIEEVSSQVSDVMEPLERPDLKAWEELKVEKVGDKYSKIGHFEIKGFLGSGASGRVYEAYDSRVGRLVAIKVIAPYRGQAIKRTIREVKTMAKHTHKNIAPIYSVGKFVDETLPLKLGLCMVMPISEHTLLGEKTQVSQMNRDEKLQFAKKQIVPLASAMDKIHETHLHRDFKPANVFIHDAGYMQVGDFGMVHELSTEQEEGRAHGTFIFMSPEQIFGKKLTKASDWFNFAASMYWVLTGGKEIFEDCRTVNELRAKHGQYIKDPSFARSVQERLRKNMREKNVPYYLAEVLIKMLSPLPKNRIPPHKVTKEIQKAIQYDRNEPLRKRLWRQAKALPERYREWRAVENQHEQSESDSTLPSEEEEELESEDDSLEEINASEADRILKRFKKSVEESEEEKEPEKLDPSEALAILKRQMARAKQKRGIQVKVPQGIEESQESYISGEDESLLDEKENLRREEQRAQEQRYLLEKTKGEKIYEIEPNEDRTLRMGTFDIMDKREETASTVTYNAFNRAIKQPVCITVLLDHSPKTLRKFLMRNKQNAQLQHGRILATLSTGLLKGNGEPEYSPFVVTERYDENLEEKAEEYQKKSGLKKMEAIRKPMMQMANALRYVHKKGLIHLNINPKTVFLKENGDVKIGGLEIISTKKGIMRQAVENPRELHGDPKISSDEQIFNQPAISAASDWYDFASTWFFLLTGEPSISDLLEEKGEEAIRREKLLKKHNVPQPLADLLIRLLNDEPEKRLEPGENIPKTLKAIFDQSLGKHLELRKKGERMRKRRRRRSLQRV